MTVENQRVNVGIACDHLAPIATQHELVISHGNGPQIGLLALEEAAYESRARLPARRARRRDAGDDRLPHRTGAREPAAVRQAARDAAHDDRGRPRRPGVRRPDQADRADLRRRTRPTKLAAERGWAFKPDGDSLRRVVPSPAPQRIFEHRPIRWLLEHGCVVICAGGGGIPTAYQPGTATRRRRGRDRQGPRQRAARAGHRRRRVHHGDRRDRRLRRLRHARAAGDRRGQPGRAAGRIHGRVRGRLDAAQGDRRVRLRTGDRTSRRHRRAGRHRRHARRHGRHTNLDRRRPASSSPTTSRRRED